MVASGEAKVWRDRELAVVMPMELFGLYKYRRAVHAAYMAKKATSKAASRAKSKAAPKAAAKAAPRRKRKPTFGMTYIRTWRKKRGLSLEFLAVRVGKRVGHMTHASLSRIERGLQPYSQPILEALAEELTYGDVAALLLCDPTEPDNIWSIWDRAKPAQRAQMVEAAAAILKAGM
jgi:transcriptional regulator with XRE-family HTH domain